MKSFIELSEERDHTLKPVVMAFGRMNPPTVGHEKLVNKVKEIADQHSAPHHVILSHSQDSKKNPLSPADKVKHAKRAFPGTNIEAANGKHPTFLHHAKKLYDAGHRHLIMVAGSDRQKEFHDLLHKYNGHPDHYNFKKIEVKSAGQRDPDAEGAEGMSASKMREHAKNGSIHDFRKGLPSHMSDQHTKELFHDVRRGMGLHEETDRGLFKAIFITGGPGSGKDIIIREGIPESRIVELDATQAMNYLMNKKTLSEHSSDIRQEAIRNRMPLIINATADRFECITQIKEELEELGYSTMMVYVDTTNAVSKERNGCLKRMVEESVRADKWKMAQVSKVGFHSLFEDFNLFQNNDELEVVEEHITDVYDHAREFLDREIVNETAKDWMRTHGKLDLNKEISSLFEESLDENNSPVDQMLRKAGKKDSVKDGDVPANPGYNPIRGGAGAVTEDGPTLTVNPLPKIPNFQKDKEINKKKTAINDPNKKVNVAGIGPTLDTRTGGTSFSGLGNTTYSEETDKKPKKLKDIPKSGSTPGDSFSNASNQNLVAYVTGNPLVTYKEGVDKYTTEDGKKSFSAFKEAIDSPAESGGTMGTGGVLNGSTNQEPMQTPKQVFKTDIIKKKKGTKNA